MHIHLQTLKVIIHFKLKFKKNSDFKMSDVLKFYK